MYRDAITVTASSAKTSTGNSGALKVPDGSRTLAILVNATASSGTPNVVLSVEWSHDGTTFASADTADAMTALTGAATKVKDFNVKGRWFRVVWTVTGGTPSLTFAATAYGVAN